MHPTYWHGHVSYRVSCVVSLPFMTISHDLHIVKCPLDVNVKISAEAVGHSVPFCVLFNQYCKFILISHNAF